MMKKLHTNILERLDLIIKETADHIHDFIDSKSAFTLIKLTLNMQGSSLEKELDDAFDDDSQLMSASTYVQQKSKLSPQCFMPLTVLILINFGILILRIRLLSNLHGPFARFTLMPCLIY